MSQTPQYYDASKVDWTKILEPSQQMEDERTLKNDVMEDFLTLAESVRLGKKPEEIWETLNLAKATGLPFSTVENDKDTAMTLAYKDALRGNIESLRTFIDSSPTMLEYVQLRPAAEGAAMVTDLPMWDSEKTQRGFFEQIAHSWEEGNYQQERMRLLGKDFAGLATEEDQQRIRLLDERAQLNQRQREGEGIADWILGNSVELLPQLRDMGINVAYRAIQGTTAGAAAGGMAGIGGGAAVGSLAPGLGTLAGAAVGGTGGAVGGALSGGIAGAGAGGFEHVYRQSVAEIWGSIRDMKDEYGNAIDPTVGRAIAAIGALPMAGLDLFSMGKVLELIPGLDKFLNKGAVEEATTFLQKNPGVMAAITRAGGSVAAAVVAEPGTEALQEGVVIAAEEIAKNTGHIDLPGITGGEAIKRMAEAGKEAFAAILPLAAGGGAVRAYANRRIQQGRASEEGLRQLHSLATESDTMRNAPDMAQDFQKRLGEDGGLSDLYIRPEAIQRVFFQTEEGMTVAAEMGITPESLVENLALDADIAIPADLALTHILNNEQLFNELSPDMRQSPDILTPREAQAYGASEEGSPSQADREGFDFLDSIFSGLDEEIADNDRRDAMAAPYVQQLVDAGYSERQAQHMMSLFVANAEQLAPEFNQTPEDYLSQRLAGFNLTTPEMANMTEADLDDRTRRQLSRAPLKERDPLLAAIWGRLDPASLRDYDSLGAKELTKKYGRGLFKGKAKFGVSLDELADELVRDGLLPEGSGANELLAALQDRRNQYFQLETPEENAARGREAMDRVIAEQTDALDAMYRDDVGSISFYWGKPGKGPRFKGGSGISHLIAHRNNEGKDGESIAREMVNVLAYGKKVNEQNAPGGDRAFISDGQHTAVLSLYRFGNRETWLLTGWDNDDASSGGQNKTPDGQTEVYDSGNPTRQEPTRFQPKAGAGDVYDTIRPLGADGKPLFKAETDPEDKTLYQGNTRGNIVFSKGQAIINLFKGKRNLSTVIHEGGHFFLENLREAAQLENAPEWVRQSWQALQQEYGFEGFELSEAVHERFAREFEVYARDGKAPSSRLSDAFGQFSNWLTRLYRSVRSLIGAGEISPDIRNVFDRLLATEEEIESARRDGSSSVPLEDLEANGLPVTQGLRSRYAAAVVNAQNKAAAAIAAQRLVEQRRMEKRLRKEAEAKIATDIFYRTEAIVRDQGGINWGSVLGFIDEDLAADLRRKWTVPFAKGLFKENGALEFADVAADFNVDSPQNLAGLLLSMPTRKEAIDADVQQAIAEWNRTFDGSMEYSSAIDAALAVEIEALTGQRQLSGARFRAELDRRMGVKKSAAVDAEYKALTQSLRKTESVLRGVMRDVRREHQQALRDETRAAHENGVLAGEMHEGAKRAAERSRWQDRVAALKIQERAKRAALAAAYRARIERDKLTRQIRKDATSKSVNDAFRQQILALVAHWRKLGTNSMTPRDAANVMKLKEFVAQHESLFGEQGALFPEWLMGLSLEPGKESAGDLSLEQLRDVRRSIQILAHQGRNYDRLLSFGKQAQLTEAAGEMVSSMNKMIGKRYLSEQERATFHGRALGMLRGLSSELTIERYLFDALDGYVNKGGKDTETGANHKYIVSGLQDAMGREQGMLREYDAKLADSLAKLERPDSRKAFIIDGVALPEDVAREWGGMFTHEKVLGVALNMGNEGNMRALMRGYGWSEADLRRIVSRLTIEELQTVQELWGIINELYPVLNETHQQLNGVPLSKVEAREITIQASDGEVTLPGGYFPLVFDHMLSRKAEEQQSVDELINRNESILRTPNPKSGMTKERTGGTLPPKLSLSVIRQHVMDTIHYSTHAPILRDVYRIIQLPEYRNAFIRAAGLESYNELTPWLRSIARPEGEHATKIDRAFEFLAKRGTQLALALNMKSALLQITSFGSSMQEVGKAAFVKGAYQMMSRPHSSFQAVREKSAYMESRSRMLDATLKEWLDRFSVNGATGVQFMGRRFTFEQVRNAQFALIRGLDAVVAYPTWIAAYDTSVASGMAEQECIRRADEAVIRAQGNGGAMDVATVMRRRGYWKLATTFMTFALNMFNRQKYYTAGFVEHLRGGNSRIDFKTFAQHFALEWAVPVVLSTMMISLGRDGELPDAEDYARETIGYLSMGIPVVRDVARFAEGQFTGKGFGSRMGGSVGFAGLESGVKASRQGYKWLAEDDDKAERRFWRELINTMGFVYGIGTPQLWRTMEGSEAYFVDDEGGILAPILGKPQKDKN